MVKDLIFVTPESQGLKSEYISDFIDIMRQQHVNLHGFMVVRRGKILAEGYYKPFNKNFNHRIYSCSKSYVTLAIGLLLTQNKIKLTDTILSFFPEYDKICTQEERRKITIEDALKMCICLPETSYVTLPESSGASQFRSGYGYIKDSWVESFFTRFKDIKPNGMMFDYDTSASYILNVIVERLENKPYTEVLRPIFDKIGVSKNISCVRSPDGYSWGGSGVLTTLRDFCKVAEFIMRKGKVNGEYLIDKDFMDKATSNLVDSSVDDSYDVYGNGYGYQIWQSGFGFAMCGMGGQFAFMCPDKDFIFVCNADIQCGNTASQKGALIALVRGLLYGKLTKKLSENPSEYKKLQAKLKNLKLNTDFGKKTSTRYNEFNNVKYVIDNENSSIKWIKFDLDNGKFIFFKDNEEKVINFGIKKFVKGVFPETKYYDYQVDTPAGRGQKTLASVAFESDNKIMLSVHVVDVNLGRMSLSLELGKGKVAGVVISKVAEWFLDEYQGKYLAHKE